MNYETKRWWLALVRMNDTMQSNSYYSTHQLNIDCFGKCTLHLFRLVKLSSLQYSKCNVVDIGASTQLAERDAHFLGHVASDDIPHRPRRKHNVQLKI